MLTQFSGTLLGNDMTGLQGTPNITVQDITREKVSIDGTLSYENVTDVNVVGLATVQSGLRVGTGGTVGPVGSGIVTYYGDGQYLTGISLVVFRQMLHKHPRTQLSHLIFLIRTTNSLLQESQPSQ